MTELLRESPHAPVEIVEVQEHRVEALLATGLYKRVDGAEKTKFDKAESPKPAENILTTKPIFSKDMEEKDIKSLIEASSIPVKYNISNDSKVDKLKELEGMGYEVEWE